MCTLIHTEGGPCSVNLFDVWNAIIMTIWCWNCCTFPLRVSLSGHTSGASSLSSKREPLPMGSCSHLMTCLEACMLDVLECLYLWSCLWWCKDLMLLPSQPEVCIIKMMCKFWQKCKVTACVNSAFQSMVFSCVDDVSAALQRFRQTQVRLVSKKVYQMTFISVFCFCQVWLHFHYLDVKMIYNSPVLSLQCCFLPETPCLVF